MFNESPTHAFETSQALLLYIGSALKAEGFNVDYKDLNTPSPNRTVLLESNGMLHIEDKTQPVPPRSIDLKSWLQSRESLLSMPTTATSADRKDQRSWTAASADRKDKNIT